MNSKKKILFYLGITIFFACIIAITGSFHLCPKEIGRFLAMIFPILLFTSSIFFVHLISTDTGFASWKKFMKYFAPITLVIALFGGFSDGGGSWAVGGYDSEIMMWLLGVVYVVGSVTTVIIHRRH
ncbi:MAG: hypothetical protein KAS07_05220 [Candidatus Pacebacteria bacterium]|nr:hypothetical protein [Candidatus Paceibacterota bacterium]